MSLDLVRRGRLLQDLVVALYGLPDLTSLVVGGLEQVKFSTDPFAVWTQLAQI